MKQILILLAVLFTLQGCNKDIIRAKSFCSVTNPVQDLPWLKTIIDAQANNKYSKMTIYKYEYQQEEGFLVDSCVNCPDSVSVFYNCSGNNICKFSGKDGSNTCPDFLTNSIKKEIVFQDTIVENRPDTYFCNVDNPLEDLAWLKRQVNSMKSNKWKAKIYRCIYNNIEGFVITQCVNCSDKLTYFYSCEGKVICEFGGMDGRSTCPDFQQKTTLKELIFEIK